MIVTNEQSEELHYCEPPPEQIAREREAQVRDWLELVRRLRAAGQPQEAKA